MEITKEQLFVWATIWEKGEIACFISIQPNSCSGQVSSVCVIKLILVLRLALYD